MWNLKNKINENEKKKTDTKNRLIVDKGEGDGKLGEKGEVIKQ